MNWLFLRSAHGGPERWEGPPIPTLDADADMWTALFCGMVELDGGDGRVVKLGDSWAESNGRMILQRLPDLGADSLLTEDEPPDVVFNRGAYAEYDEVLAALPSAVRVYYGAGDRWIPPPGAEYDLILVDTPAQREAAESLHPESRVEILHKPAAPCFRPVQCPKRYDVVFNCHRADNFKGHRWLIERLPPGTSVLRIGPADPWWNAVEHHGPLDVVFAGRLERREIPAWACQARVGVVCDDGEHDSGPRVLPELLAMNIPVLVRSTVRADLDAYVVPETGIVVDGGFAGFQAALRLLLDDGATHRPRWWYVNHFDISLAAWRLVSVIRAIHEES